MTGYLIVSAVLLTCGVVCMATKRNAVGVLMGVELVLNAASINFVAAAYFGPPAALPPASAAVLSTDAGPVLVTAADPGLGLDGQIAALFVIVLAAAEAAVALAIVLAFFNNHGTADVDAGQDLSG